MNILMMTNTFIPHVGGVARSIQAFSCEYRRRGHRVVVIAPTFPNIPAGELDIIRIPAIQKFNGSDFSVALPIPGLISAALKDIKPDVIHSHHPFLIGASALRIAHTYKIPLVFTHHTKYEDYTHYVPGDSEALKRFVINLSTSYANLCDLVFTPSESIASIIRSRGVTSKIVTIPTGVDTEKYKNLNGLEFRKKLGIPEHAFVVGHLGRLAKEKNLQFLATVVEAYFKQSVLTEKPCFLLVGVGPMQEWIVNYFEQKGYSDQLFTVGLLDSHEVVNAYHAMDVFVFSSKSETQGMVITEAMAAGTPVVALDAPGVREVVQDGKNGRLLSEENVAQFSSAIEWLASAERQDKEKLIEAAKQTAEEFSLIRSTDKALKFFEELKNQSLLDRDEDFNIWTHTFSTIESEWERIRELAEAAEAAFQPDSKQP